MTSHDGADVITRDLLPPCSFVTRPLSYNEQCIPPADMSDRVGMRQRRAKSWDVPQKADFLIFVSSVSRPAIYLAATPVSLTSSLLTSTFRVLN